MGNKPSSRAAFKRAQVKLKAAQAFAHAGGHNHINSGDEEGTAQRSTNRSSSVNDHFTGFQHVIQLLQAGNIDDFRQYLHSTGIV